MRQCTDGFTHKPSNNKTKYKTDYKTNMETRYAALSTTNKQAKPGANLEADIQSMDDSYG